MVGLLFRRPSRYRLGRNGGLDATGWRKGSRDSSSSSAGAATLSAILSQRGSSKGKTSLRTGPIFASSAERSRCRARCSRVLTVSGRTFEERGGLLDAHFLDDACDEDQSEVVGQLVDRLLEQVLNLTLRRGPLRVRPRGADRKLDDFRAWPAVLFHCAPIHRRSSPPQAPERLVHDDAAEPGSDRRLSPEFVEMQEGLEVGLLNGVLCLASSRRMPRAIR